MSVVFFEGFNINNSDTKKLDTDYWSVPNNNISFGVGRTSNALYIKSSPYASGMALNKRLDLVNFDSPLASGNSFGLGFYVSEIKQNESKLISVHNNLSEVLAANIIITTYNDNNSIGIEITQNGSPVTVYDFQSPLGYTYSFTDLLWENGVLRTSLNQAVYLEFFVDAKNTNTLRIRVNGLDMLNSASSTTTAISGFNNIDKISFYGSHDNQANSPSQANRLYDDLYLTSGSGINDTLLGSNTKIYRILPESNSNTLDWSNTSWDSFPWNVAHYNATGDVQSNNGDNSYIYTTVTNNTILFNMQNLPESVPSGIGGVKFMNTARKLIQDGSFTNVYSSGDGQTISEFGPQYLLDSTIYRYCNSFSFKNPQTENDWTINDINNMQLGVRKL